jgi:hypothetical protein
MDVLWSGIHATKVGKGIGMHSIQSDLGGSDLNGLEMCDESDADQTAMAVYDKSLIRLHNYPLISVIYYDP